VRTEYTGPPIEDEGSEPRVVIANTPAARHSFLERLRPSRWPVHFHDCGYPKAKHSWTHVTSGWCSLSKPGSSVALCPKHRALHYRAWDVPNPSQKAVQIALDEAHEANKARAQAFEDYLYQDSELSADPTSDAYKRMMQFLYDNIEEE